MSTIFHREVREQVEIVRIETEAALHQVLRWHEGGAVIRCGEMQLSGNWPLNTLRVTAAAAVT